MPVKLEPTETLLLPKCTLGPEGARERLEVINEELKMLSKDFQFAKGIMKEAGALIMKLSKEKHSIQMMLEGLPKVVTVVPRKKLGKRRFSVDEMGRIAKALGMGE